MFEQSGQQLDENAVKSLIASMEANLGSLERQREKVGEPTRKSLEAQIREEQKKLQDLRRQLEELERQDGVGHA